MLEYTHEERRKQTRNKLDDQHVSGCVERISSKEHSGDNCHGTVQIIRAQVQKDHRSGQILALEPI
jgi:hypothetical protein